ncbi:unnamed protein product [Sphagnum balticum]
MATDDTNTEFGFCCLRLRGCWLKKGIAAIETSRKLPLRTTGPKPHGRRPGVERVCERSHCIVGQKGALTYHE